MTTPYSASLYTIFAFRGSLSPNIEGGNSDYSYATDKVGVQKRGQPVTSGVKMCKRKLIVDEQNGGSQPKRKRGTPTEKPQSSVGNGKVDGGYAGGISNLNSTTVTGGHEGHATIRCPAGLESMPCLQNEIAPALGNESRCKNQRGTLLPHSEIANKVIAGGSSNNIGALTSPHSYGTNSLHLHSGMHQVSSNKTASKKRLVNVEEDAQLQSKRTKAARMDIPAVRFADKAVGSSHATETPGLPTSRLARGRKRKHALANSSVHECLDGVHAQSFPALSAQHNGSGGEGVNFMFQTGMADPTITNSIANPSSYNKSNI